MIQTRLPYLLLGAIALGALACPTHARAQWWSSREPVDYEDCAERAGKTADAKQRDAAMAACESKFAGRRKPGGGYTYYDFMQDRHFDIAGPNPTADEQREIDQHYTAFLDQNRRSIIAAAFARRQRELTEAKLSAEATAAPKPAGRKPSKPPAPSETTASPPQMMASLAPTTPPTPLPRPSVTTPRAATSSAAAKPKRGGCEPSLSCGWSRFTDGVSNLTKTLFGPPPKKPARS